MKKILTKIFLLAPTLVLFVSPLYLLPQQVMASQANDGLPYYDTVADGILSRSGLPNNNQLGWLNDQGVKSLVNLIPYKESNKANITKLSNFKNHSFNYLNLAIANSFAPTDSQGKKFLSFVTNKNNQPVHVFCKAGIARTGTMVALYRYSVQGWTMAKAIKESRSYGVGVSKKQSAWLNSWAKKYKAGSWK